jgi:hypothetical protein
MIFLISFFLGTAHAAVNQAQPDALSRALQQAKRVAVMENGRDLPSRAFWVSRRVVANTKAIAYQTPKSSSKVSKKSSQIQAN